MKWQILLAALCLGILVGVTMFSGNSASTGTATFDCYVENAPCICNEEKCICGNHTVPAGYCSTKV
ncbi:MAG: hypothetical protein QW165_03330 [Candidatus Woesearchaeota archaeon]